MEVLFQTRFKSCGVYENVLEYVFYLIASVETVHRHGHLPPIDSLFSKQAF